MAILSVFDQLGLGRMAHISAGQTEGNLAARVTAEGSPEEEPSGRRPLVTVVLPFKSSGDSSKRYLKDAVDSILRQSFRDFELLIFDSSAPEDFAEVRLYERLDGRVAVLHEVALGAVDSLNRMCRQSRGKYVAFMTADDISLPNRLASEVFYMEQNPGVGVLGTGVNIINSEGQIAAKVIVPCKSRLIEWSLIFEDCVSGPSIMIRRDLLEQLGYFRSDSSVIYAEDYDLLVRASKMTRIEALPDILVQYRNWKGTVTTKHRDAQQESAYNIMFQHINNAIDTGVIGTKSQVRLLSPAFRASCDRDALESASLIIYLLKRYLAKNVLDAEVKDSILSDAAKRLLMVAWNNDRAKVAGLRISLHALVLYPKLVLFFTPTSPVRDLVRGFARVRARKRQENRQRPILPRKHQAKIPA